MILGRSDVRIVKRAVESGLGAVIVGGVKRIVQVAHLDALLQGK